MKIHAFPTYETLSTHAAEQMVNTIRKKNDAVICLASGHTPKRTCEIFVMMANSQRLDLSAVHFVGLDEWVGVPPNDPGSCHYFFSKYLFEPLQIKGSNYHLFDVSADDLAAECSKMDALLASLGGIDLMIVGIGMNGHIGFNEPGIPFDLKSHVAQLHNTTTEVGQKYFSEKKVLSQGITLGLSYLTNAEKVLLLANGEKKAEIVAKAVLGPVDTAVPASILQRCEHGLILLDREAAGQLPEEVLTEQIDIAQ